MNHTYPGPGSYVANVQITDAFGCVSTLTDTVIIPSGPTADAGPDVTLCSGYSVQLGNGNLPAGQTYTWSPGTGLSSNTSATPTLNYTNTTSNPVTLNYIMTATSGFCTSIDYVTVVVYPTPTATITGNTNICLGQSTTLTASGGSSYLWNDGSTTASITVSPTTTTTYLVSAVDGGCTSAPAQVTVNVSQGPVAIITGPDSVCAGDDAVLTAVGGTAWLWSVNNNTNQSITLQNLVNPTTVSVVASVNGCQGPPATFTVYQYSRPVANFNSNVVCVGNPTSFTDISAISPGGVGGVTGWNWNFADPVTGSSNTSTLQNPQHTFSAAGTYNVQLITTAYNGCRDTIVRPVVVNPLPQPDFTYEDVCIGETMVFTNTTPGNITSFLWDFDGNGTSTLQNPTATFLVPGAYNITLTVTNSNGCVNRRMKTVFVHPRPVPEFTYDHQCFNTITNFTSQSYIIDPFGTTLDAHAWNFGDPNSGAANTSSDINPTHSFSAPGVYNVTLTVTSSQGCSESTTIQVQVDATPEIPVMGDTICRGFNATVMAFNPVPGTTLEWFYTPTSTEAFQIGPNFYNTPPLDFTTSYYVAMRDEDGCLSGKWGVVAYVIPEANVDITVNSQELEIPTAILEINVTNVTNGPIVSYVWDFGDGSTSNETNPVHQYTEEGIYDIMLTATNWFGCVTTQTWGQYVEVTKDIKIFIPTAFTPDGNGLNDVFEIETKLITTLSIVMYDRWGKQIYVSDNIDFQWDGTYANQPLPEGVYTYVIQATEWDGGKVTRSGTVTLLR